MTTLGTFHMWFALLCEVEQRSGEVPRKEWPRLGRMGEQAYLRGKKLGAHWRDAVEELGSDVVETRLSTDGVSSKP